MYNNNNNNFKNNFISNFLLKSKKININTDDYHV